MLNFVLEKAYNFTIGGRPMTLKVTHGHQKWRHSVGHTSLPYVLCSNNVYRPIAPFSRPVTYGMPSFSKYIRFLFPQ